LRSLSLASAVIVGVCHHARQSWPSLMEVWKFNFSKLNLDFKCLSDLDGLSQVKNKDFSFVRQRS
jgi:hypothetical protein